MRQYWQGMECCRHSLSTRLFSIYFYHPILKSNIKIQYQNPDSLQFYILSYYVQQTYLGLNFAMFETSRSNVWNICLPLTILVNLPFLHQSASLFSSFSPFSPISPFSHLGIRCPLLLTCKVGATMARIRWNRYFFWLLKSQDLISGFEFSFPLLCNF